MVFLGGSCWEVVFAFCGSCYGTESNKIESISVWSALSVKVMLSVSKVEPFSEFTSAAATYFTSVA